MHTHQYWIIGINITTLHLHSNPFLKESAQFQYVFVIYSATVHTHEKCHQPEQEVGKVPHSLDSAHRPASLPLPLKTSTIIDTPFLFSPPEKQRTVHSLMVHTFLKL